MSGARSRIANAPFEGQRVRGVYFFAGDWRFAPPGEPVQQFYEYPVSPNDKVYTIHPVDARHLGWSESVANQGFALDTMVQAGANTVIMSYWGERGTDRWAFWAPMQTSTYAHDELFTVATSRPLLIMPAIESGAATIGCSGISTGFNFASDFPGSQADPSPGLVRQCVDLIGRYLHNPQHPEWAQKWLQLFDRNGEPRYAMNLLHVSSDQIAAAADATFADGFNWVADRVLALTGVKIGFTLDILLGPQTLPPALADCRGWTPWFAIHGETTTTHAGGSVTALWASDSHLDLFMTDARGAVSSIWWDKQEPEGYRPQGWFAIHPEQPFPVGAPVTAVWANEDHLDLFAVDPRGAVQSIWWDRTGGGYRSQGWFPLHPETNFPPGSPITAVWKDDDHLDLFATDTSGVVQSIWWDRGAAGGYRPQGWFSIHPETRTAPGGQVTAQWSSADHLDLFITPTDGTVSSIWWDRNEPSGYRSQGWFAIGPGQKFQPGTGVVALWAPGSSKSHLDLFSIDEQGTVLSDWWDASNPAGYRQDGWFPIGPDTRSRVGGNVGACWIGNGELHLAMTDSTGTVSGANWKGDQSGGWSGWFPLRSEFVGVPGQPMVLLSRLPSHADLFLADPNGIVKSTFRAAVEDTYVASASRVGGLLNQTAPVLGVQGFIPEVGAGGSDDHRLQVKRDYWQGWLGSGVPVMFDVCPGYDAHLVFPGSSRYGNNESWRDALTKAWSSEFQGVAFNTWNGYTEGYAAVPTIEYGTANWDWIQGLFKMAKS